MPKRRRLPGAFFEDFEEGIPDLPLAPSPPIPALPSSDAPPAFPKFNRNTPRARTSSRSTPSTLTASAHQRSINRPPSLPSSPSSSSSSSSEFTFEPGRVLPGNVNQGKGNEKSRTGGRTKQDWSAIKGLEFEEIFTDPVKTDNAIRSAVWLDKSIPRHRTFRTKAPALQRDLAIFAKKTGRACALFISAPDTTDPINGIKDDIVYFSENMRSEREPELRELANELHSKWINGIVSVRTNKSTAVRAALNEAKQSQAQSALERSKRISLEEEVEKIKEEVEKIKRERDEMKAELDNLKAAEKKAKKERKERKSQRTMLAVADEGTEEQAETDEQRKQRRRRAKKEEKRRKKEIEKRAEQTSETVQQQQ